MMRKMQRTRMRAEVAYSIIIIFCQSKLPSVLVPGQFMLLRLYRRWKMTDAATKSPKKMIWMNNPPTTIFSPSFGSLPAAIIPAPEPWIKNEKTSPTTKIVVSHFTRMMEHISPLGSEATNNSTERHVDGGGKEGRRDEQKEGLNDVGHEFVSCVVSGDSADEANDFHY